MLLRNCVIRAGGKPYIAIILQISYKTVLNQLVFQGSLCKTTPLKNRYKSVQMDEYWSYVKHKKKGKRWLIYAYAPETDEVLGYVIIGKRDIKTVKKLYKQLKNIIIDLASPMSIVLMIGNLLPTFLPKKTIKLVSI